MIPYYRTLSRALQAPIRDLGFGVERLAVAWLGSHACGGLLKGRDRRDVS